MGIRSVGDVLFGPPAPPLYEGGGGFGSAKGTYFLRRSQESPPPALAAKLWPWVDAAVADYAAGGVPNPDLAGKEFLSLLRRLPPDVEPLAKGGSIAPAATEPFLQLLHRRRPAQPLEPFP